VALIWALLILLWARWSRLPWRDLGFARPESWLRTVTIGIVFGVAFKLLMKVIVMPLLGAPAVNQAFHYLAGNRAALPYALFTMMVVAGFGEETVFRGFMFERLRKWFGTGPWAMTGIVLFTATWFGLDHYGVQGVAGAQQAAIFGLVFGAIRAVSGHIWMLMIAHAAFDLTAYSIIYWKLETAVARLVFQ
jgi:membrane protease YdiL (CAAX protease family)